MSTLQLILAAACLQLVVLCAGLYAVNTNLTRGLEELTAAVQSEAASVGQAAEVVHQLERGFEAAFTGVAIPADARERLHNIFLAANQSMVRIASTTQV